MAKITVQNTRITALQWEEQDYISLTDMASAKDGDSRSADNQEPDKKSPYHRISRDLGSDSQSGF